MKSWEKNYAPSSLKNPLTGFAFPSFWTWMHFGIKLAMTDSFLWPLKASINDFLDCEFPSNSTVFSPMELDTIWARCGLSMRHLMVMGSTLSTKNHFSSAHLQIQMQMLKKERAFASRHCTEKLKKRKEMNQFEKKHTEVLKSFVENLKLGRWDLPLFRWIKLKFKNCHVVVLVVGQKLPNFLVVAVNRLNSLEVGYTKSATRPKFSKVFKSINFNVAS